MNMTEYFIAEHDAENKKDFKRITTLMSSKHKRFLEDKAHDKRITLYEALYDILEDAMKD